MLFNSPIFLFLFLPLTLLLYYSCSGRAGNIILVLASLFFYAWGETVYISVMVAVIISTYIFGVLMTWAGKGEKRRPWKWLLALAGIGVNLAILIGFKYTNFFITNVNGMLEIIGIAGVSAGPIHLPLGISFFIFQAISYLADVYQKKADVQKNIVSLSLYIALFPQLIAGPIVRYTDLAAQIVRRDHRISGFALGVRRFIYGLSKKMLVANPVGEVADTIFSLPSNELTLPLAWVGTITYTLQIFFDFSGYSDMAIGLGKMFGFRIPENFDAPYFSKSIREFWRRWHISLSTWFRDYVFIPLGGSRVGVWRTYRNLFLVFILTGFWHGAEWNFIVWGLFHGIFIALEHAGLSRVLNRLYSPIAHLYMMLVVMVGWVFFRAESLDQAMQHLNAMFFSVDKASSSLPMEVLFSHEAVFASVVGVVLCIPLGYTTIRKWMGPWISTDRWYIGRQGVLSGWLVVLMYLCMMKMASSTYDPFIYFRF